jgi:flagellar biosynthesis protein FlhF
MIIKTFTAETSAAALKRVREEMGGDAIVLRSGRALGADGKPSFEVTACLEKATVGRSSRIFKDTRAAQSANRLAPGVDRADTANQSEAASESDNALRKQIADLEVKLDKLVARSMVPRPEGASERFDRLCRQLRSADLPEDHIAAIVKQLDGGQIADDQLFDAAHKELVKLTSSLMLPSMSFSGGDRIVISGPAGAGKSSVMGKLASLLVARDHQKVKLVTLDSFKMTAYEELVGYAEILGAEMVDPYGDQPSFAPESDTITLIDTPSTPTNSEALEDLRGKIESTNPTTHIAVFSCLTRSADISRLAAEQKKLAPTHLIMTMTDLTDAYGSMIAAATALDVPVAMLTDSPGGTGNLHTPDPDRVARTLLKQEVNRG